MELKPNKNKEIIARKLVNKFPQKFKGNFPVIKLIISLSYFPEQNSPQMIHYLKSIVIRIIHFEALLSHLSNTWIFCNPLKLILRK